MIDRDFEMQMAPAAASRMNALVVKPVEFVSFTIRDTALPQALRPIQRVSVRTIVEPVFDVEKFAKGTMHNEGT